jgi:PST family polysaccharide transporter
MSRKNMTERRLMMKKLIPIIFGLGIIGYAVIFFLGDWIINLLYKDKRIIENIDLFKVLGLIIIFSGLNMLYLSLFAPASKLYKYRLQVLIIGAITTLVLNLTFVPIYGINATIYSFTFVEGIMLLLSICYYLWKEPKDKTSDE